MVSCKVHTLVPKGLWVQVPSLQKELLNLFVPALVLNSSCDNELIKIKFNTLSPVTLRWRQSLSWWGPALFWCFYQSEKHWLVATNNWWLAIKLYLCRCSSSGRTLVFQTRGLRFQLPPPALKRTWERMRNCLWTLKERQVEDSRLLEMNSPFVAFENHGISRSKRYIR